MEKAVFDITGMTCSACSSRVAKAVAALDGVDEVNVNLLKNTLTVRLDPDTTPPARVADAVVTAGYGASFRSPAGKKAGAAPEAPALLEQKEMRTRLFVSFLFTVPLFYISMGHMAGLPLPASLIGTENAVAFAFTQFLLTIPVMFVNFKYYRTGFKTLFSGSPNMDSLIAIGSGAAAVFGVYAIYKMAFALGRGDMDIVHHFAMNPYF